MRHRPAARLAVAAAALLLLALPAALATPALAGPASRPAVAPTATATADPVAVHLTSQLPLVPAPGGTLTLSGYVQNTGKKDATDVEVRLRLSPTPVRSRAEIASILAGEAGRTGVSVAGTRTPVATTLPAGGRAPFTLTVPLDSLGLTSVTPEVRVIGVESLARVGGSGRGQTGFVRSFLPWFPDPAQVSPTKVTWLFGLSTRPSMGGDGVFLDDHLAQEVAPEGRLSRLLDAASAAPTSLTWVVDPALVEALQAMSDGYDVRGPDGKVGPGPGGPSAAAWLERLRILTTGAEVVSSAYALPDVVALHRAGLDLDIALSATTDQGLVDSALGRAVATGMAWPTAGLTDDGTLDALRASGARTVVLSSEALPPNPEVSYTPSGIVDLVAGSSPLRALLADPSVSTLVAAPLRTPAPGSVDAVVRRQTTLAELALTTLELPSVPRTLVVAADPWWSADGGSTGEVVSTLDSPWSVPQSYSSALATPASTVPRARADYGRAAKAAELPPGYLATVATARDHLSGLSSVAPDTTEPVSTSFESALTRGESGSWRRARAAGLDLVRSTSDMIDEQIAQVRVLSHAPITLPGDSGVIPVTVANDLDRPARVALRLVGSPPVRFDSDPVELVTIAPGKKQTLEVQARVLGTGAVTVEISLITPEGAEFGTPVTTEVRSAAYARAAQWVVGGLLGILVVLLVVSVVRRRREVRREEAEARAAAGTDDGTGGGA